MKIKIGRERKSKDQSSKQKTSVSSIIKKDSWKRIVLKASQRIEAMVKIVMMFRWNQMDMIAQKC